MICDAWQVVVVPFPFTDRSTTKRRPALVLSQKRFNRNGHTILAMITSSTHEPWPGDTRLTNLDAAGLRRPCIVRLKIFTLDNRFIARLIGLLATIDQDHVGTALSSQLAELD